MTEQVPLKALTGCAVLMLLAGCAPTGAQVEAARAACDSRGGIKLLWPDVISSDRFHVSCVDGSEISGKVHNP